MRNLDNPAWKWSGGLLVAQEKPYEVMVRLHPTFALDADTARLIEAAPALRKALETALGELERDTCGRCGAVWDACACPNGEWWRSARAALAKAKGEAA